MTDQIANPPELAPKAIPRFEQLFRLWLAGFGMSSTQCDVICAHPRIAMSIRTKDSGGIVQDLSGCLRNASPTSELCDALNNPGELLFLMKVLDS